MKYEIETTSYTGDGTMFKTRYDDADTYLNAFLARKSVFSYVRDLVAVNTFLVNERNLIKVDDEIIWTKDGGFIESWLKKELEYNLRN